MLRLLSLIVFKYLTISDDWLNIDDLSILKYSVPNFIKNNSELMKKIKEDTKNISYKYQRLINKLDNNLLISSKLIITCFSTEGLDHSYLQYKNNCQKFNSFHYPPNISLASKFN